MENAIVIVEDHDPVRQLLSDWLVTIFPDFNIIGTKTAEDAFDVLKTIMPKLMIIDINLPGMNGIDATRIIKKINPNIKVTILSIYEDDAYKNDAFIAGASCFVPKRLMHSELVPTIKSLLSNNGHI